MYEITGGPKEGETKATRNGARMCVINSEGYDATSYEEADAFVSAAGMDNQETPEGSEASGEEDNPLFDGPPADPRDVEPDEPECPDCGSSRYGLVDDYREHIPDRFHREYQYVCAECKELYNDA